MFAAIASPIQDLQQLAMREFDYSPIFDRTLRVYDKEYRITHRMAQWRFVADDICDGGILLNMIAEYDRLPGELTGYKLACYHTIDNYVWYLLSGCDNL